MRILALQGSPRIKGNTQAVLEIVMESAKAKGARTETIQLAALPELRGCMECFACQKHKKAPACAIKDDMQTVLRKAMKADVIVWATPVFCWSPAWPLKIAMDRCFCTFKFVPGGKVKSLFKGHGMAAVITAGGTAEDGADLVVESFKRLAKFSQARWLGVLVAGQARSPEALRSDAKLVRRARAFGGKLA
jgi:multimeric flavodoxin WrbA